MSKKDTSVQGDTTIEIEDQPEGEVKEKGKPTDTKITGEIPEDEKAKLEEKKKKFDKKKEDIAISLEGLTKDTQRRSMSMEKSNERNQMATASSMFIIHVGILRTVVNTENAQYYGIQVGLVVTALVLQLIAGLLSVYIGIIRNYYSEHHGDCTEDCVKICLPCSCVPVQTWKRQKSNCSNMDIWLQDRSETDTEIQEGAPSSCKCCPYHWLCHQYDPEEREALHVYKKWQDGMIKSKLRAVLDDEEEDNRDMLNLQGEILTSYVQEIRKNKILRRATFWQNVMSVVVFFVFILNALFTGFGLITLGSV